MMMMHNLQWDLTRFLCKIWLCELKLYWFYSNGKIVQKVLYSQIAWPNANTDKDRELWILLSKLLLWCLWCLWFFGFADLNTLLFPYPKHLLCSEKLFYFCCFSPLHLCCLLKMGRLTPCQKFGQCCFHPGQSCHHLQEIFQCKWRILGQTLTVFWPPQNNL